MCQDDEHGIVRSTMNQIETPGQTCEWTCGDDHTIKWAKTAHLEVDALAFFLLLSCYEYVSFHACLDACVKSIITHHSQQTILKISSSCSTVVSSDRKPPSLQNNIHVNLLTLRPLWRVRELLIWFPRQPDVLFDSKILGHYPQFSGWERLGSDLWKVDSSIIVRSARSS